MDTKLEYQLTPEQAEQLALEAAEIRYESLRARWALPVLLAIFSGILGLSVFAPVLIAICRIAPVFALQVHIVDSPAPEPHSSLSVEDVITVGCIIAFSLIGFVFGKWRQSTVLNKIRKRARETLNERGAARSVTWNENFIAISSPAFETKLQWRLFKRVVMGKSGIHLLSDNRTVALSIPNAALPSNIKTDDLIKVWQNQTAKPPVLS